MTTRYDLIRDNLKAAVDACLVSKLISEEEKIKLDNAVEELVYEMESYNE